MEETETRARAWAGETGRRRPLGAVAPLKRALGALGWLSLGGAALAATVTVGPWTPVFKGIDLASGQQAALTSREPDHQALCLRVDLQDPDIRLFTTPKCTNCSLETLAENPSHFLEQYGLQAVVNGGFYGASGGGADSPLGTPDNVLGLAISQGKVVSAAGGTTYAATLLFTSNNAAFYLPTNNPPTNVSGIYTAITGNHALLVKGVNVNPATPTDLDPRTALGLSQDRRYLFMMTLDGRQPGWSDGADFHDTGEWLRRFGASDGINVDGGGSTTMSVADCVGTAVRLNRSSYVASYGRERNTGHNFGVWARPLPDQLNDFQLEPGTTTAIFTWETDTPSTTQVEYGATADYGSATPLNSRLVRKHVATLAGLSPGATYYYRAISTAGSVSDTHSCRFDTRTSLRVEEVFGLTQVWTYNTNNLDGTAWQTRAYDDSRWLGQGPGLLCVEVNPAVSPKNTVLPPTYGQVIPRTYYFRTRFPFSGSVAGVSLVLSNYIDDGAVFYLNGAEAQRVRMPKSPATISNSTAATTTPCQGTAQAGDAATICPDLFTLAGDILTNLVQGENVLAVEVHNYTSGNDLVFGSALIRKTPVLAPPRLYLVTEEGWTTFYWNGEGFTLQWTGDLGGSGGWSDVPGPVTRSPHPVANGATTFYRLRL